MKQAEAENAAFTVVMPQIVDLNRRAGEDEWSILEIKAALGKRLLAFGWIERDAHLVSVSTKTKLCNGRSHCWLFAPHRQDGLS